MTMPEGERELWWIVDEVVRLGAADPSRGDVVVYDVREESSTRGQSIPISAAEARVWADARRAYLDALSGALVLLYRAQGRRDVEVDLHAGKHWTGRPPSPLRWPGRRGRATAREDRALREFQVAEELSSTAYQPVREEIERRLAEDRVEREAQHTQHVKELFEGREKEKELRRRERAQSMRRRQRALEQVACDAVWVLVRGETGQFVYRVDVPPSEPVLSDTTPGSDPKTPSKLEVAILQQRVRWDRAACDAVERECAALGEPVTFAQWWNVVSTTAWLTKLKRGTWVSRPRPDVTAHPAGWRPAHSHYHSYSGTTPTSGTF